MRRQIHTSDAPQPSGAYSQAVEAAGLLFVAGQGPAIPRASGSLEPRSRADDFEGQARQALTNLASIARAGGTGLANALRVTVYLSDMVNFSTMDRVYREFFDAPFPARTTVQAGLGDIEIEIDAILLIDGRPRQE